MHRFWHLRPGTHLWLVAAVAGQLALAACGGGGDDDDDTHPPDAGGGSDATGGGEDAAPPDAGPGPAFTVTPDTLTLAEGGASGTFTVALTAPPAGSIEVTVASSDTGAVTASPATLTFTSDDYDTPQTVTVAPVDDPDAADESATVTLSAAGIDDATVTVTVTDDDSQGIVVSPTEVTVVEGATGVVSVRLAAEPAANVTVTVASSDDTVATAAPSTLVFTPADWDDPQDVTIEGVDDEDVEDETATVTLSSTGLSNATVNVTVADDDSLNIAVAPPTVALTEGGAGKTIGVTLTQQPSADVTVTIATADPDAVAIDKTSMTFTPGNYSVTQLVTVTPVDDDDTLNETVAITFSAPTLTSRTATVTVADDDTQAILVSDANVSVTEGGTATFTVRLAFNPVIDADVTITSSDTNAVTVSPATVTFSSDTYQTPKTITVTGVQDDDLAAAMATLTLSSAVAPDDATVAVAVTDDDSQAIQVNPASLTVAEGGSGTIDVRLAFQPPADVTVNVASLDETVATVDPASQTLTFTPADWNMDHPVTVSGVVDADLINDNTTVRFTSSDAPMVDVPVTVTDVDVQNIVVTPSSLQLDEGGMAKTFAVHLAQMPGSDVTVTLTNPDSGAIGLSDTSLVFTPGDYADDKMVTVTPKTDPDTRDESVVVTLSAPMVSDATVQVTVTDPDEQAIVVDAGPAPVQVTEGDPTGRTIAVSLAFEPDGPTDVTVVSNDPGALAVSPPATLQFTPSDYDRPQTVTVTGVDDPDLVDESVQVDFTAAVAPTRSVTVGVLDDDTQDILVSKTSMVVTEDIGPDTFTVRLAFQPSSAVVVNVTPSDPAVAVDSPTLTFQPTDYDRPQTVTVSGATDDDLNDHLGLTITVSDGTIVKTVSVDVLDDDTQALVVTPDPIGIAENKSGDLAVRLAFRPDNDVSVAMTTDDPARVSMNPTMLTFSPSNYSDLQTVTVSIADDIDTANEIRSVTATPSVLPGDDPFAPESTQVNITDDDVQQIVLNQASVAVCEDDGSPGANCTGLPVRTDDTTTVRLQFDPLSTATVTIASADPRVTVSPTSMTFMGGCDGTSGCWNVEQTLTVTANDDADLVDDAIVVTLSTPIADSQTLTVNVTDDDQQAIVVTPGAVNVTEEGTATFGVHLTHEPADPLTVNVASQDASVATTDVTSLTFDATNYGDDQVVTVSGTTDANLDDESTVIDLTDSDSSGDSRQNPAAVQVAVDVTDNDVQTILFGGQPEAGACDPAAPTCPAGFDCVDRGEAGGVCSFRLSMQEGGPTATFTVSLEFPPQGGGTETISFASSSGGDVTFSPPSVAFDSTSFSTPVTVTVTPVDEPAAVPLDADNESLSIDATSDRSGTPVESLPVDIIDDENTVIHAVTYAGLSGATNHTKRQNIRWNGTRFVITATDDATGDRVVAMDTKTLDDFTGILNTIGQPTSTEPVEAAEYDGVDFGLFANDGADRIVFTRGHHDLATGAWSVPLDRAVVVGANAAEYWPALDTLTDPDNPRYGLLYRDTGTSDGLYFVAVDPGDGSTSGLRQITASGALPHEKPNLHRTDSGWLAIYTSGVEVHCVRLNPDGSLISNDILSGFPGDGELVSSVYNGATVVGVYQHATGLFAIELNPDTCGLVGGHRAIRGPGVYPFTPFIAYNGVEYLVVFDMAGSPTTVGAITLDAGLTPVDEVTVGPGSRPSAEWLGDRWAVRVAGSVDLVTGSFQSHCHDGAKNADEDDVDCGGADCRTCFALWGADGRRGRQGSGAGFLYSYAQATGAASQVGMSGLPAPLSAMDYNPADGNIYAIDNMDRRPTPSPRGGGYYGPTDVWTIDPATGAGATLCTLDPGGGYSDAAFTDDGTFYAFYTPDGWSNRELVRIDLNPDSNNRCAQTPVDLGTTTLQFPSGLAGDDAGRLVVVPPCGSQLLIVDPAAGDVTTGPTVTGCPNGADVRAAAFTAGRLYAFYSRVSPALYEIDVATGEATALPQSTATGNVDALAGKK